MITTASFVVSTAVTMEHGCEATFIIIVFQIRNYQNFAPLYFCESCRSDIYSDTSPGYKVNYYMEGGVTLSTWDTGTQVLFLLQCPCINPLIKVCCSNSPCIREGGVTKYTFRNRSIWYLKYCGTTSRPVSIAQFPQSFLKIFRLQLAALTVQYPKHLFDHVVPRYFMGEIFKTGPRRF